MPRIKKKGTSGQAKNFITRTQAVRKLQVSLPDFRRLCIFKGIYPREPRNKKKASASSTQSTTFYYTKDIQYLLHEPLLSKFREHKSLAKKIGRLLGRGEVGDAARLERTQTPKITLDHIIKERYPTFVDALRDLDDALSMLFLFANLPSTSTIPPKTIALCQRLCLEFEHYLIITHSLRKSFLSIKGIYYQATIQGQDILWLVPYKFVQRVTGDIDFRIMGTFVEFYTTLLGFVNFRLYSSVGLIYPPKFDAGSDERGGELGAFTLQGRDVGTLGQLENGTVDTSIEDIESSKDATERAQAAANTLASASNVSDAIEDATENTTNVVPTNTIDTFTVAAATDADILIQPAASSSETSAIFSRFTFFLSRETPRQPLEFLLKAFGCRRVAWDTVLGDGSYSISEADSSITHQIVDRPSQPVDADADAAEFAAHHARRVPGRTYVQPQWVWDCVNEGRLLRPDLYTPGATLPPHLSPWVRATKGVYDPTAPLPNEDAELDAIAAESAKEHDEANDSDGSEDVDEVDGDGDTANDIQSVKALADLNGAASSGSDDVASDVDTAAKDGPMTMDDDFGGFSDASGSDSEAETGQAQRQRELLAEASGQAVGSGAAMHSAADVADAAAKKRQRTAAAAKRRKDEEVERAKMMMPRRKRKLFEKMQYSNAKRDAETEKLQQKRRKVETAAGGRKSG